MTRLLTALTLSFAALGLAGCEMDLTGGAEAEAPAVAPEVAAALPPGVPASVVFQTADGCYAYAIEVTDPPTGFRLRDRNGNVVCPPGVTPSDDPAASGATS